MSLKLLEQMSLPGDPAKANEDSFASIEHAALVMDGATPLGPPLLPGKSDAAWIAQFGARRLAAHLKDGDAPKEALRHALQDAEKSFAGLARAPIREKWQTPCASLMMAVELGRDPPSPRARSALGGEVAVAGSRAGVGRRGTTIEFYWYGDCSALIEQDGRVAIVGEAIEKRQKEAQGARRLMQEKKLPPASGINRPEIEPFLRAARNRINSAGNWLFAPDARAARHVFRRAVPVAKGARLLLATDGFLALVSDYGAYDAPGLMRAAAAEGLQALGQELRALERADQGGTAFPRFKVSDDATALLLERI